MATEPPATTPAETAARHRRADLEERDVDDALTPPERVELAGLRRFETHSGELIARAAREPGFAAGLRRFADGGTVWLGFTHRPGDALRAALGPFPWPERAHAYLARRSLRELTALREALRGDGDRLAESGVRLSSISVDQEANVVALGVLPDDIERAHRELTPLGDAVRISPRPYLRRRRPGAL